MLFVDMKTTFVLVNRNILLESMRGKKMREGLVVRCKKMLKEIVMRLKVRNKERRKFWTGREMRQGCPLNPRLFTLLIADLDEELVKGGGVMMGEKDLLFAYADDVALVTEDKRRIKEIIRVLKKYVERKELEVNLRKTKIMRCKKGSGRRKKVV